MPNLFKTIAGMAGLFTVGALAGPFLVPVRPQNGLPTAQERAAELGDPRSQFVTLPFPGTDGLTHHYLEKVGRGQSSSEQSSSEPSFLLLHGYAYNSFTWDLVFDMFAQRGRTVAYDRIAFGLSQRLVRGDWTGQNPYDPAVRVAQTLTLMDALGLERPILVGNSAGGYLAVEMALAHPDRVAGLILVDPAILRSGPPTLIHYSMHLPQIKHLGPLLTRIAIQQDLFGKTAYHRLARVPDSIRERLKINQQVHNWEFALSEYNLIASRLPDITDRLPQVTRPTLVVNGREDVIVSPEQAEAVAAAIPQSTLAVLDDCGHLPQEECPEQLRRVVSAWLDSLIAREAGR